MSVDEQWMGKALALARKGEGLTRPNPPVGALVVRRGVLVGQGCHLRAGKAHAEVLALKQAGERARGATLYVTLEPCSTVGRTPPCSVCITQHGIKRVVVAVRDPNPPHRGKGFSRLRKQGIEVVEGICADEAHRLIMPFAKWVLTGRPYVTLKLGMSLDGKIADYRGVSRWVTGAASRSVVQDMRRRADAVIVGAGTVCVDNPSLLPKPAEARKPFRVILDARGRVRPCSRVLSDNARSRTIMVTTSACPDRRRNAWLARGASVWKLRGTRRGVSLPALLDKLGKEGLLHVLCEGGSDVASRFIRAELVDEYVFFVAPRIIGGRTALSAVGGAGWKLDASPELAFVDCRSLGRDMMVRAQPLKKKR
ncbi:bifunctional diaminohydroxyphosphoribosylaminopyrimidine deaminase/5-amino-6-(5-phosphoribosylamino)uracil reductase RibD [Verrucomicrobiota bacterium]